jgi:hypothetical protein
MSHAGANTAGLSKAEKETLYERLPFIDQVRSQE